MKIKKTLKIFLALILFLSLVCFEASGSLSDMDEICKKRGFGPGIAKWERNNVSNSFFLVEELPEYTTFVIGNGSFVSWTSEPATDYIVSKEGKIVYQHFIGGNYGNFTKKGNVEINYVYFCKAINQINNSQNNNTSNISNESNTQNDNEINKENNENTQIPEFSTIGLMIVVLTIIGTTIYKKTIKQNNK